ncbi:AP-3 complex subunit beta [Elasticomyces elasticus]|nr:AP-3 complex subunit beta [Elasticomyces elasticus]
MESISRISSMLETARDLTLEAARDAGSSRRSTSRQLTVPQIKKLLDSRNERDVLEGLRKVIALQYDPHSAIPTLPLFPFVLKTLSNTTSPTVRPLVSIYLQHHAPLDPDTALLSINSIQKLLSHNSPQTRASALKTLSGIRVPVISQIVSLAIKKACGDMSPIVRKAAALACVKCTRLDPGTQKEVEGYLVTLLGDKQYFVAGAAVMAFMQICPDRLDLVHNHYRSLIRKLVDMDDWGQLATLRLMTVYARRCFPRRTRKVKKADPSVNTASSTKGFYDDNEDEDQTGGPEDPDQYEELDVPDPDLTLLLQNALPLLQSRNSAVIVGVACLYLYLSPDTHLPHAIGPMIALLRGPQDIQQTALYNIVRVCLVYPMLFTSYYRHFLFRSSEAPQTWRLKLELLTLIFPHSAKEVRNLILAELSHFAQGNEQGLVRESVRAIGRCAQNSDAKTAARCLTLLMQQIHAVDSVLVAEAVSVIRQLIQRDPSAHERTVIRLAKNLDTLTSPQARASIVWLVGEFASSQAGDDVGIAADVLRILVKGYVDEQEEVRCQIVLLAAKIYLHHQNRGNRERKVEDEKFHKDLPKSLPISTMLSPAEEDGSGSRDSAIGPRNGPSSKAPAPASSDATTLLWTHVSLLARYTPSYDLRDRTRLFRALLSVPSSTDLASLLLLAPKPVPQAPSPSESRQTLTLGSASLVVGEDGGVAGLMGYEGFPDWVEEGQEPDARLRDDSEAAKAEHGLKAVVPAGKKLDDALAGDAVYGSKLDGKLSVKEKTLDDWLAEDETESEEETDESEEEDEESEEDEETDESESDDAGNGLMK